MEKGCVLRIMGRSEEGAEIFTRAMERFPFHHVSIKLFNDIKKY